MDMKLSQYAKKAGVTYKTAWRWYKAGALDAYQTPTGMVIVLASGLNDNRPKFLKLLADPSIGTIIVEHRDRGTRFGWSYLTTLLEAQGRRIEAIFPNETQDDLVDDFVSLITSMAARIYGRRGSRRRAERIKQCVESVMKEERTDECV
jgi:putative resolvase